MIAGGECPWAGHTSESGEHVVQSGFRVVFAATRHCQHWQRPVRLAGRVTAALAGQMLATRCSSGAPTPVVAAMFAAETNGLLSSQEANRALRAASTGGGRDAGLPGLLEFLERRGDVVYVVRWRVVRSIFVCADYSVAGDGALRHVYELSCPGPPGGQSTHWDVTKLYEAAQGSCWSAAVDYFRNGKTPEGCPGVNPLSGYVLGDGYVLNASAVYWQTRAQSCEALRSPQVSVTDTSPKTNSTTMEYGAFMVKNSFGGSCQAGHYLVNGLSKANYEFVHAARRHLMGPVAERTEMRLTDGDPQLQAASELDGASRNHGLCRFHTINLPLRILCMKHGFSAGERDAAADFKDYIHHVLRSCETEAELEASHMRILSHIDDNSIPAGPTRRRQAQARAKGVTKSTKARSSQRKSRTKYEVARFVERPVGRAGDTVKVMWVNYEHATEEPIEALVKDLGPDVFCAYCRAAGIEIDHTLSTLGGTTVASAANELDNDADDGSDVSYTVQRFNGVDSRRRVIVKWVGSQQTTAEPASNLLHDLGPAEFAAYCNAAAITEKDLDCDFKAMRDASVTSSSILRAWYLDIIWPKRRKLAYCYRRGIMHMNNDTTGCAEVNFQVT